MPVDVGFTLCSEDVLLPAVLEDVLKMIREQVILILCSTLTLHVALRFTT